MKNPLRKRRLPVPVLKYEELELTPEGQKGLDKAFDALFEEVMRRRKLSTASKASLNN